MYNKEKKDATTYITLKDSSSVFGYKHSKYLGIKRKSKSGHFSLSCPFDFGEFIVIFKEYFIYL